ncbi:MAG TPA: 2-phosphosulfolactate phosphatase [Cytophagales bacterium]|nr:2-phosphosulfolactate phosphatase [Cytophagales bacterium]
MKKIDVCLSPELLHLYSLEDQTVVIVDILRATSCMVTGIAHGVESLIPVATIEECKFHQCNGLIAAAEREGKKIDGFEIDNSPFSYMNPELKGKTIAMTTTNGTLAITKSLGAREILIGAFLNISALVKHLAAQQNDVLVVCAGWKGKVNLEDTLFAGALVHKLKNHLKYACDAPLLAETAYLSARENIFEYLKSSSHFNRLKKLNVMKDIEFCLKSDVYEVIPVLKESKLVKLELEEFQTSRSVN